MCDFKMAFGRGAYYSLIIGSIIELVMVVVFLRISLWLGIVFLLLMVGAMWLSCMSISKSHYEITSQELILHMFGSGKKKYLIDRIRKIIFVDMGTEWIHYPPNARYQLEIYFDRKYLKSVEPVRLAPEDRVGFVDCLLERNPEIIIEKDEVRE